MKKRRFIQQIVHVETMGLNIYCETELGQYKKECQDIDSYEYGKYEEALKKGNRWGWRKIAQTDSYGVTFIVLLPQYYDQQGIVNFCASLALTTVAEVVGTNINPTMVGRLAGVIYSNLYTEEIEEEETKTTNK